jgi:8-oxo-dGTP pyrophosphatase MutT (NUDIX family)
MMREERDLYNEKLELTNKTYFKGDDIPKGYYPMVVMIAIQNSNGDFLMQKRVESKGGDWGVTGGHPKHGETPEQGIITEVKEELGIDISNQKIIEFERGCDGKDCYIMYYTQIDLAIEKLIIQLDELSEVRWFSMKKLQQMVESGELNKNQVEFFNKCVEFLNN